MMEVVVDTLIAARDALLGQLPMSSMEFLKQIPHPTPQGWDAVSRSIIASSDWDVPDEQKVLTPELMDPGYDPGASDQLRIMINNDPLIDSLATNYTSLRMAAVALPDTGPPVIGGIRIDENAPGASTAKIGALYALYQLLYEMSKLAAENSLTTIRALQTKANQIWAAAGFTDNSRRNRLPRLNLLFQFYDKDTVDVYGPSSRRPVTDHFNLFGSDPKLFFKKEILQILWWNPDTARAGQVVGFSHGEVAGLLFRYIGFAYVASVMIKSGLFKIEGGLFGAGIWVKSDYNGGSWSDAEDPIPIQQTKTRNHRTVVTRPGLPSIQNITARAVADFFVLLWQGRIVSQSVSNEMLSILGRGGCIVNFDEDALRFANKLDTLASKCGYVGAISNDALLMADREIAAHYVIVVLANQTALDKEFRPTTPGKPSKSFDLFKQIRAALQNFS